MKKKVLKDYLKNRKAKPVVVEEVKPKKKTKKGEK